MSPPKISVDLDDYHRHEALDRANMLAQIVGEWLLDHPYVQQRPELVRMVSLAQSALADAYQLIGVGDA